MPRKQHITPPAMRRELVTRQEKAFEKYQESGVTCQSVNPLHHWYSRPWVGSLPLEGRSLCVDWAFAEPRCAACRCRGTHHNGGGVSLALRRPVGIPAL